MSKYNPSKVLSLFRKFGGLRLVLAYAKLGVLMVVLKETIKGIIQSQTVDKIYSRFQPVILNALRNKYHVLMYDRLKEYDAEQVSRKRNNIIWCCWLQGFENAPAIVKACIFSLLQNIHGKEICFIDEKNLSQYICFPKFIQKRWRRKQIPPAMYADLIRLELLIKYGGTWIDSTVLCTGLNDIHYENHNFTRIGELENKVKQYLNADLFMFQFKQSETAQFAGISNWFITSHSHNVVLSTLRDMLYKYWKDFDCVLEYYIFHRFFEMIAEERPNDIITMPYGYSPISLALRHNWGKQFKQAKWDKLVAEVPFHKLAHQVEEEVVKDSRNYYNYILGQYLNNKNGRIDEN